MDQSIIGHDEIATFFKNELKKGIGGRCYLFEGKRGIGKRTFAQYLAFQLLGLSPADVLIYSPTGKSNTHPIETLKSIKEEAQRSPHGSHLMMVIDEADKMAPHSSQALLKVFEEPPLKTIFILITENKHKLLPTILSRSQIVPFKPLKSDEIRQAFPDCTEEMLTLAQGSFGRIKQFMEKGIPPFVEQTKSLLAQGKINTYFELQEHLGPIAEQFELEENRELFFSVFFNYWRSKQLQDFTQTVPFDKLFKAVKNFQFSVGRFTSTQQALETLFLEIYD
jgi:Cdc6-like AAA superfamily ATPase